MSCFGRKKQVRERSDVSENNNLGGCERDC